MISNVTNQSDFNIGVIGKQGTVREVAIFRIMFVYTPEEGLSTTELGRSKRHRFVVYVPCTRLQKYVDMGALPDSWGFI